jgi:uncharacterized repeat protein (TIGR03806 family)
MQFNRHHFFLVFLLPMFLFSSCKKDEVETDSGIQVFQKLSSYKIYQGAYSNLIPSSGYHLYEESSMLFTDSCEKQRLIYIPAGKKMVATIEDGLPVFPTGTVVAKTFFYYKDKRDTTLGKKIIETRLLVFDGTNWIGGTYAWNEAMTDGELIGTGKQVPVTWTDKEGKFHDIKFGIANDKQCIACHQVDMKYMPVGPQIKHMNMNVTRNGKVLNQLAYFQEIGILEPMNPAKYFAVPNSEDTTLTVADRARGYLDINCAYCHNPAGYAATKFNTLNLNSEIELSSTHILEFKEQIKTTMASGRMPLIRSYIKDKRAIDLVTKYINGL